MVALDGRGAAGAIHEVHGLDGAVDGMAGGEAAAGLLLQGDGAAGGNGLPDVGGDGGAVGLRGAEESLGAPNPFLDLGLLAQQAGGLTWGLAAGELGEGVEAGAGDAGGDGAE